MKKIQALIQLSFCALLLIGSPIARAHGPAQEMADAANRLLDALKPEQREKAVFEMKSDERFNWHFIPRARKGLSLKGMTGGQRALAHALLNSGLSHPGYLKATTIMSLEAILHEIEQGRGPARDPELYFVSIFGKPDGHGTWAWRFEGHHLALNFTIVDGHQIAAAPSFFGSNPAEVREGPRKGLRALGREEDLARQLVRSLDDKQRQIAIYTNTAPRDIITAADRKARLLKPDGLSAAKMTKAQSDLLWALVKEYAGRARAEVAAVDLQEIEQVSHDQIFFAWAGPIEPGHGHYYRIQGPTFLLEYDNTQNNANHVHAVWRDLKNDFGDDLLLEHYRKQHGE